MPIVTQAYEDVTKTREKGLAPEMFFSVFAA
jgi:hypothetical protein